jgi:hypothetical protein
MKSRNESLSRLPLKCGVNRSQPGFATIASFAFVAILFAAAGAQTFGENGSGRKSNSVGTHW